MGKIGTATDSVRREGSNEMLHRGVSFSDHKPLEASESLNNL